MKDPTLYSYQEAAENVQKFENILLNKGIKIKENSTLKKICDNILKLVDKDFDFYGELDIRPFYREVLGLNDLIIKIIRIEKHPKFDILLKHLHLLNETQGIVQTDKNLLTDQQKSQVEQQNSNKIFELLIAAICLSLSNDVEIDDPEHSKGDNPDVLIKFKEKQWGLACKTINIPVIKPKNILDNIEIGVEQIENSNATIGIPVINLKNILLNDELWPIRNLEEFKKGELPEYLCYSDIEYPTAMLGTYGDQINNEILKLWGWDALNYIFNNKKSYPGALLFLQTAVCISKDNQSFPTTLGIFHLLKFNPELEFLHALNLSMHNL